MIKGVNKHIIEIIPSEDEYFERAILYLKPNCNTVSRHALLCAGEKYLSAAQPSKKRRKLLFFLIIAGTFLLGASLTACIMLFL